MSLRNELRKRRKNLPSMYRDLAVEEIVRRVTSLTEFNKAKSIAGYAAFDGEVDPFALLSLALNKNKRVFLPRIHRNTDINAMDFVEVHNLAELTSNHFGILEPINAKQDYASPDDLEIVLAPLVGFDNQARRIGMGYGYYDQYFSFTLDIPADRKRPYLIGLAFDCQYVNELPLHSKDVPLDIVITESAIYRSSN
jgi:5-formyltetrahydrofolate cyclo-ligase